MSRERDEDLKRETDSVSPRRRARQSVDLPRYHFRLFGARMDAVSVAVLRSLGAQQGKSITCFSDVCGEDLQGNASVTLARGCRPKSVQPFEALDHGSRTVVWSSPFSSLRALAFTCRRNTVMPLAVLPIGLPLFDPA